MCRQGGESDVTCFVWENMIKSKLKSIKRKQELWRTGWFYCLWWHGCARFRFGHSWRWIVLAVRLSIKNWSCSVKKDPFANHCSVKRVTFIGAMDSADWRWQVWVNSFWRRRRPGLIFLIRKSTMDLILLMSLYIPNITMPHWRCGAEEADRSIPSIQVRKEGLMRGYDPMSTKMQIGRSPHILWRPLRIRTGLPCRCFRSMETGWYTDWADLRKPRTDGWNKMSRR